MGKHARLKPQYQKREIPADEPTSTDKKRPIFCLEYIQAGFDVKNSAMSKDQRAAFAERLQEIASQTWSELKLSGRHKQGFELMPVEKLAIALPPYFEGTERVWVFRYDGRRPMVGVRSGATFHILAIEREFGELYSHGS